MRDYRRKHQQVGGLRSTRAARFFQRRGPVRAAGTPRAPSEAVSGALVAPVPGARNGRLERSASGGRVTKNLHSPRVACPGPAEGPFKCRMVSRPARRRGIPCPVPCSANTPKPRRQFFPRLFAKPGLDQRKNSRAAPSFRRLLKQPCSGHSTCAHLKFLWVQCMPRAASSFVTPAHRWHIDCAKKRGTAHGRKSGEAQDRRAPERRCGGFIPHSVVISRFLELGPRSRRGGA